MSEENTPEEATSLEQLRTEAESKMSAYDLADKMLQKAKADEAPAEYVEKLVAERTEAREARDAAVNAHNLEAASQPEPEAPTLVDAPAPVVAEEPAPEIEEPEAPALEVVADPEPEAAAPAVDDAIAKIMEDAPQAAPLAEQAPELIAASKAEEPEQKFAKVIAGYDTSDQAYQKRDEVTSDKAMHDLMMAAYKEKGKKETALVVEYWAAGDESVATLGTDHVANMAILEGTGEDNLFRGAQGPGCETMPVYLDPQGPACLNSEEPIFNGLTKRPFDGCEVKVPLDIGFEDNGFLWSYGQCDPCDPEAAIPAGLVIVDGVDFNANEQTPDMVDTEGLSKPVMDELPKTSYRSFKPYASGWAMKVCRDADLCDPLAVRKAIERADVAAARRDEGMLLQAMMAEALWRGKSFEQAECCINSQFTAQWSMHSILSSLETEGRLSLDGFDTVVAPRSLQGFFAAGEGQGAFGQAAPNLGSIFSDVGITNQILTPDWVPGTDNPFPPIPGTGSPLEAPIAINCDTNRTITTDLFFLNRSAAAVGVGRTKRVGFGEEFADWGLTLQNCRGLFSERERMMIFWGCCPIVHLRITLTATGGIKAGFDNALACAAPAAAEGGEK